MSTEFIETLDTALEQLRQKKPIPKILERYPDQAGDLLPLLYAAETLDSLQAIEMPAPDAIQSDRLEFLAHVRQANLASVSPGLFTRLKGWMASFIPQTFRRKENQKMSALLARAMLVFVLLFGASSGVYAMADNSLPNEPMYGAKLAMEQVQLNMASNPAGIAEQHLAMAQNRVQEIVRLAQNGTQPDKGTMTRLENHLNAALRYTAQLGNDGEMLGLLIQARAMVQRQLQTMNNRVQIVEGPSLEPLRLTYRLLNQFQNRVEAGLQDPQAFRWQHQNGQYGNPDAPGGPGWNPDCPNCPCEGCEPSGDQNQYGQNGGDAPGQPGGNPDCPLDGCVPAGDENKYGQGGTPRGPGWNPDCPYCPCEDCEPAGDQNRYGQNSGDAPGQPGGNPDCPCDDCVPAGDENQYGPQPEQPGPGQPEGNPDCPSDDCEPVGDQNGPNKP